MVVTLQLGSQTLTPAVDMHSITGLKKEKD